ncbi:MAG: methyltransferase domain-containing protein [Kiloniellales bacterium]
MSEPDAWQVSGDAAVVYEEAFVPAIFAQWAPQMAEAAGLRGGDRVLDVGCGTGVLAREAATAVGPEGRVTGLDINDGMLAVARRLAPEIDWRQGDAAALPFEDGAFDAVVSQFVLMFVPDRQAAVAEMGRVLAPGGRLAVAVWVGFDRAPGYAILTEITGRRVGSAAAEVFKAPFALGDEAELAALFHAAGLADIEVRTRDGWARYPSIDHFIRTEVKGSPVDDLLDEAAFQALLEEAREELKSFRDEDGRVAIPLDARIVTARKP